MSDIKIKKGFEREFEYKFVDRGYSTPVRIFNLECEGESENRVLLLFEAGRTHDNELLYHVIEEAGTDTPVPASVYDILTASDVEEIFNIKIQTCTESHVYNDFTTNKVKPLLCSFSEHLHIVNVDETSFEKISSAITNTPIDINVLAKQRYFEVMTEKGLIIFKKIMK